MAEETPMWEFYTLTMKVEKLTGGLPKHPEIIRRWQEAKWPAGGDAVAGKTVDQAVAETEALVKGGDEKAVWTGFAVADGYACLEARNIKAMLKEAANIVKTMTILRDPRTGKPPGYLRSKVAERVFVEPTLLRVCPASEVQSAERPIHVMTMQGPRTALKRVDYAEHVTLECTIRVLTDGVITEKILRTMLAYAQWGGLGTDRSTGSGMFTHQLTKRTD